MKLLKNSRIKAWDQLTLVEKQISSFDLMQQASATFAHWFQTLYFDKSRKVYVLAGPGNNGGDGLCVAAILAEKGYHVTTYLFLLGSRQSLDNKKAMHSLPAITVKKDPTVDILESDSIIIDALLGSGLRGEVKGSFRELIQTVNKLNRTVVSIDTPSGMNADGFTAGQCINCDHVLSFEIPKMAFFLRDNAKFIKSWDYRSIGLSSEFLKNEDSDYHFLNYRYVRSLLRSRNEIDSKYAFGFGHLCGGSNGMFGAMILGSRAAMRSGLGRLIVSLPSPYGPALISAVPEVMVTNTNTNTDGELTTYQLPSEQINAVAVGPGLSTSEQSVQFLDSFLADTDRQAVLDADALNIIARQKWRTRIPKNTIITPHHKEFERLFGSSTDHFSSIELQIEMARELSIYIVLKGKNTTIVTPRGKCYFNNTGNVGMATAGSGDVLTGMILSFLGQGYTSLESCLLAVYVHGSAGDQAALKYGVCSMIASDIIEFIPETLKNLHGK